MNNPAEVSNPASERAWRDGLHGVLEKQLSYLSDRSNQLLKPRVDSFIASLKLEEAVISCVSESQSKPDTGGAEKRNPSLFLEKTTLGMWTLKYLNHNTSTSRYKYLHSRINPLKEAQRQLADQHITGHESHLVLLGIDLLYLLEAIITSRFKNSTQQKKTLIIFTQSIELLLLTFAFRELLWLSYFEGRIEVYLAEPQGTNFHHDTARALVRHATAFHSWLFITTREGEFFNTDKNYYTTLQNQLLKSGQAFYRTALTRYAFEKRWLKNILSNIRYLNKCYPLASLHNHHTNGIAIIIGAGPSLDQYKDDLKELDRLRNQFLHNSHQQPPYSSMPIFIALDSALPTLTAMNIIPDYIVALDGGYYNTFDFSWAHTFEAVHALENKYPQGEDKINEKATSKKVVTPSLLTHVGVYPTILRDYVGKIYAFTELATSSTCDVGNSQESLTASILKMIDLNLSTSQIAVGGSVLHAALGCTLLMGFSKVIFYGIDFACPYYWSHAKHAIHNQYLLHKSDRFHSLTSEVFKYLKPTIIEIEANTDNNTHTSPLSFSTQTLRTYADKLGELLQSSLLEQQKSVSSPRVVHTTKPAPPHFYTVSPYAPKLKALTFLSNFNAVNKLLADHRAHPSLAVKKNATHSQHPMTEPMITKAAPLLTAATLNERILKVVTTLDTLSQQTEKTMSSLVKGLRTAHDRPQHEKIKDVSAEVTFNTLLEKIPAEFDFVKILLQTYQPLLRDSLEQRYYFLMVTELRRIFHITATKLRFLLSQQ
ncbi:hypothetical protein COTS27_00664 [Spirochaetota bacterium]|nr:hypothetical protein COTS27_00664 [Spirochaetota bacterium]